MNRAWLLLLMMGCGPKPEDARILKIFPRPPSPIRVYYKDQLAGEIGWRARWIDEGSVQLPGPFQIEHVRIEMLTPDGWVPADAPTSLRFQGDHHAISLEDRGLCSVLLIDNRNHDPVKVTCGKMTIDVPKDAKLRLQFPIAQDKANTRVTLNGEDLGAIEAGYADTALVDVTGERNYFFFYAKYSAVGFGSGPSTSDSYRRKRFHKIGGSVDLFLEKPPQKLENPATLGVLTDE